MFLLAGLGNPGTQYKETRHNIGFMSIDHIIAQYDLSGPKQKFHSNMFEGNISNNKVIALKPQTFMNKSGIAISKAASFYKIPSENIIVIYDDLDLALGKVRVKFGGGNAGHNGLKSIEEYYGKEYKKIRIGISHPGDKHKVNKYVLSPFSKDETISIDKILNGIAKYISLLLKEEDEHFMSKVALAKEPVK